jgi:hypothetical protein
MGRDTCDQKVRCPARGTVQKTRRWQPLALHTLTAGKQVPVLLVCAVTDVRHVDAAALELTAHTRVDTLRPPP